MNAIENLIGLRLFIFEDGVRVSRNNNPIFMARVERKSDRSIIYSNEMFEIVDKLIDGRKRFKGELSIRLTPPSRFQIWDLLKSFKEDKIIVKHEESKTGFITLFLNDGINTLTGDQFFDTCTRYQPDNPMLLTVLKTPSDAKLRALAKGQHFIHPSDGTVVKYLEDFKGRRRVARFIAPMDGEDEFNDEFSNFLSNHGLGLKEKLEEMFTI